MLEISDLYHVEAYESALRCGSVLSQLRTAIREGKAVEVRGLVERIKKENFKIYSLDALSLVHDIKARINENSEAQETWKPLLEFFQELAGEADEDLSRIVHGFEASDEIQKSGGGARAAFENN